MQATQLTHPRSAPDACRYFGIEGGVAEVAKLSGTSVQNIYNWYSTKPKLFYTTLLGVVKVKEMERADFERAKEMELLEFISTL